MACITTTITGNIEEWGTGNSYFTVFLRSNGRVLDSFDMTTENQEILTELREGTLTLLGIHNSTQCFLELISELGLELPKPWHKYWKPKELEIYWSISDYDNITDKTYYYLPQEEKMVVTRYNMFPTKELAERAVNLSELGRLMLLWQYANDCVYEPDWKQDTEKWFLSYDIFQHQFRYEVTSTMHTDLIYFETKKQLENFSNMNGMEIIRLMGMKS
mgnify:FL=1